MKWRILLKRNQFILVSELFIYGYPPVMVSLAFLWEFIPVRSCRNPPTSKPEPVKDRVPIAEIGEGKGREESLTKPYQEELKWITSVHNLTLFSENWTVCLLSWCLRVPSSIARLSECKRICKIFFLGNAAVRWSSECSERKTCKNERILPLRHYYS